MNLEQFYDEAIQNGEIENDSLQRELLQLMQRLAEELKPLQTSWFNWRIKQQPKGLYIYGPVGAGKTYLVDLFYERIAEQKKARFHFHHFMQQIDMQLRQAQGQKDPLLQIAKDIAASTRLICFDEFLVQDVAYAMILAELLQALHKQGVILVISSNTHPDDLYHNGVHRERFLPAIKLLKEQSNVFFLNEQRDYRLGRQPLLETYFYPLNAITDKAMQQQFLLLSAEMESPGCIRIQNRDIPYIHRTLQSIWFSFDVLCNLPRSQLDYLQLAELFDTIFVSDIPILTENHTAQTIMLIYFIDVMYDRGINVIISAEVALNKLYVKGELQVQFRRTLSRLTEMQSIDYLKRHPRREVKNII